MKMVATKEKWLTTISVITVGMWVGGRVTLGAIVAPVIFRMVPAPTSADAMTVVFRRFDKLAMACAALLLIVEAIRAALRGNEGIRGIDVARVIGATAMTAISLVEGMLISPKIAGLHESGAIRGFGEQGKQLDAFHDVARALGEGEMFLAIIVIAFNIFAIARCDVAISSAKEKSAI